MKVRKVSYLSNMFGYGVQFSHRMIQTDLFPRQAPRSALRSLSQPRGEFPALLQLMPAYPVQVSHGPYAIMPECSKYRVSLSSDSLVLLPRCIGLELTCQRALVSKKGLYLIRQFGYWSLDWDWLKAV